MYQRCARETERRSRGAQSDEPVKVRKAIGLEFSRGHVMTAINVLVLRAPGTNCDFETCHAFECVGASTARIHVEALLRSPEILSDYQVLVVPGGFSYGDDVAAGKILANQLRLRLAEPLCRFRDSGRLILGICNGFQVLIKSGLLPGWEDPDGYPATLTRNDSGRFEDRWVHLAVDAGGCPFLEGITHMELPVAHAEGKFICRDDCAQDRLDASGQIVLRYCTPDSSGDRPQQRSGAHAYPVNPNGSEGNVAGICDPTGQVLGLMPHPERHIEPTQHPHWTRRTGPARSHGLDLFRNAVQFFD